MPRKSTAKRLVTLYDVNVEDILRKYYGGEDESSDEIIETPISLDNKININTLMHEKGNKSKNCVYFIDPNKEKIKLWVNMYDISQNEVLPRYTNKPCWWCRSTFSYHPIGCPIKYNSNNVSELKKKRISKKLSDANLTIEEGIDYFETEGVFCTFPCVKAYILDKLSKSGLINYKKSLALLSQLYTKLTGEIRIMPTASSWKMLIEYGGHLTPEEFRASTGVLHYTETVNIKRPLMYCSSMYFQEKRVKS